MTGYPVGYSTGYPESGGYMTGYPVGYQTGYPESGGCRISGPDPEPVERPNPDPVLIRRLNFRSGTTLI